jgi:hypothetical protein
MWSSLPAFAADIIAVDNNLDTDIGAIMKVHFVMKGGQIILSRWVDYMIIGYE